MTIEALSAWIKQEALRLGFDSCGIAPAELVNRENIANFYGWIGDKHHQAMGYMERNMDKRCDPKLLVDGAQSIISVALSYAPDRTLVNSGPAISYHALGADYHRVIKDKLYYLLSLIKEQVGEPLHGRPFVDSAPVLERYWAWRAGLGWIGKSNMLIIPGRGSYMFLGELIVDRVLAYDTPMDNRCGGCSRCIDSCPTQALTQPYCLDATYCISYHTIESKLPIPHSIRSALKGHIYGCDICLDACPHNRNIAASKEPLLMANERILAMQPADWIQLTPKEFEELFRGSSVVRIGFDKLRSNIDAIEQG